MVCGCGRRAPAPGWLNLWHRFTRTDASLDVKARKSELVAHIWDPHLPGSA